MFKSLVGLREKELSDLPPEVEVGRRWGGWDPEQGPIPDVWHDHLRKPGHRCLWSVNLQSNATPQYPKPETMSQEMLMYELRDVHDRHLQLMTGALVLPQGQRKYWDNPQAAKLYEAIQTDGGPRLSDVRTCLAGCRGRSPDYVMYAAPGQPSLWPLEGQGKLQLGYVRFRPGWPSPGKQQNWAFDAKLASKTPISPEKAQQIAIARSRVMGFLDA